MKHLKIETTTTTEVLFDGRRVENVLHEIAEISHEGLETNDPEIKEGCFCRILDLLGD